MLTWRENEVEAPQHHAAAIARDRDCAALWRCHKCRIWWCSQPEVAPTTFLLDLPVELFEELGWENFRGWRLGGFPHAASCPQCRRVSTLPVLGAITAGPPLRVSLHEIFRPPLAVAA